MDANDVLFNGLGVWLGYALFLVFAWLFIVIARHIRLSHIGLLAYIREVCRAGLAGTSGSSEASSKKVPNL